MSQSENLILNSLPRNVFVAVERHLTSAPLNFGNIIAETKRRIDRVYFPHSGVVSLVVKLSAGEMIETAMVGRDGVVNATSALDGKLALHRGIVQVAGEASAISADSLRTLADKFAPLRQIIIGHEQVLLAQVQQSAACNASHSVEARLCRWLLRIRDLTGKDDALLTQDFVAQMLGVRRASVSAVAGALKKAGSINYNRGRIQLLDIPHIKNEACECYDTVKRHYARLVRQARKSEH